MKNQELNLINNKYLQIVNQLNENVDNLEKKYPVKINTPMKF